MLSSVSYQLFSSFDNNVLVSNEYLLDQQPQPSRGCNCNGHSTTCTPDGRCLVNHIEFSFYRFENCFLSIRTVNTIQLVLTVNIVQQVINEILVKV